MSKEVKFEILSILLVPEQSAVLILMALILSHSPSSEEEI
jgi:hypothetical protein